MSNGSIDFHYIATGARRNESSVLFLHGFMGSANDWLPIMEQLSDSRHCIALDLPGHGSTTVNGGDESYSFENSAAQLVGWMDLQEIEKAVLVGYSLGGRLALYMLITYPERFGKGVLESASPGLIASDDRAARIESDNRVAEKILRQPLAEFLIDWYDQPVFKTLNERPALIEQLIAARKDSDVNELARALRGMSTGRQPSLWNDLTKIQSDVRLIVGADDHKFVSIAQEMQKRNKKLSLSIVENSSHNVHLEQQGCFFDILREFLNTEENR